MRVLKVFAKNVYNGKQLILRENATEEDFEQDGKVREYWFGFTAKEVE